MENIETVVRSPYFLSNQPTVSYQDKLIEDAIKKTPSCNGTLLSQHTDLQVSHIDPDNANVFVIGNKQFSARMWCKDGKLFSQSRKCLVDILPGHNIRDLHCEYRVSLPSLDVYLHALECGDLYYPNPPNPVVTSCGVVALNHDHTKSPHEIFVLLTRRTDYKEEEKKKKTQLHVFKKLLEKLILPNLETDVTPQKAMQGIERWEECDVKSLSEMTMDSLQQVMTKNVKGNYDSRWNELFARPELPQQLKEVQDICVGELKRLEEVAASESMDNADGGSEHKWLLPETEFMSRFDETGIYMEGSVLCGMRALMEKTGLRITMGQLEKSSVVDVTVEGKGVRGALTKYYVWHKHTDVLKHVGKNIDAVKKLQSDGYKLMKPSIINQGTKYLYKMSNQQIALARNNVVYVNLDGTKVAHKAETSPETGAASTVVADVEMGEEDEEEEEEEDREEEEMEQDSPKPEKPSTATVIIDDDDTPTTDDATVTEVTTEEVPSSTEKVAATTDVDFAAAPASVDEDGDVVEVQEPTTKTEVVEETKESTSASNGESSGGTKTAPIEIDDAETPPPTTTTETNGGESATTLDEYAHLDEDDVILVEDGHPQGKKKSKEQITADIKRKQAIEARKEKREEERKKQVEQRKKEKDEIYKTMNEKRDGDLKDLPPRDVHCLRCEWVVLDKALELCPQFKKVHESSVFQEHLTNVLQQLAKGEKE